MLESREFVVVVVVVVRSNSHHVCVFFPVNFLQRNSKLVKFTAAAEPSWSSAGESNRRTSYSTAVTPVHARHVNRGIPGGYATSRNRVHSWRTGVPFSRVWVRAHLSIENANVIRDTNRAKIRLLWQNIALSMHDNYVRLPINNN